MATVINYLLDYHCTNCGHIFKASFPMGKEAPDKEVECPRCGCNSAVKNGS